MAYIYDLADTWNNAAVTYTAIKMNVTDTASNANSMLMDLQVGGTSRFSVRKSGETFISGGTNSSVTGWWFDTRSLRFIKSAGPNYGISIRGDITGSAGPSEINLGALDLIAWRSNNFTHLGSNDTILARDAAGTLAQLNGTNAQTFRLYNTYTDASNYERGKFEWASNVLRIGTEKAGTGSARALELQTDGTTRMTVGLNGYIVHVTGAYFRVQSDLEIVAASNIANYGADLHNFRNYTANSGAAIQLAEMTAPAAPAANNVRIYAEDNGSGKTRLMALFPTGAAVQLAIEP